MDITKSFYNYFALHLFKLYSVCLTERMKFMYVSCAVKVAVDFSIESHLFGLF